MKHILSTAALLAIVIASLTFLTAAQENSARVWLTFSAEQATTGQEVTVTVNVSGAEAIYGSSFKLSYDPQVLEVVTTDDAAVQSGSFFGDAPNFPLTNKAEGGVIEYAMTLIQPAEPVSGEGVLGTITLRALTDTAVLVTPLDVSLVSPQFTEVNGQKVAESMNTVQPQIAESSISPVVAAQNAEPVVQQPIPTADNGGAAVASVSVAGALVAQPSAPQTDGNTAVSVPNLVLQPVPVIPRMSTNPALIFAAMLFLLGIGLLVISVGMYTRMRSVNLLGE